MPIANAVALVFLPGLRGARGAARCRAAGRRGGVELVARRLVGRQVRKQRVSVEAFMTEVGLALICSQ